MSDESSRLIESRVIHPGRTVRLELEKVELPGGHVTELEVIHHPGASCVLPFVTDDRVVLIRQFRHAAGGFLWEAPAGKLDPGEHPDRCAGRELEEETGYRAGRLEPLGPILTTPGFTDERIHLYTAHDLSEGTQAVEEAEVLTVEEMPFDEALAMVRRGEIDDAKTMLVLLRAEQERRATS